MPRWLQEIRDSTDAGLLNGCWEFTESMMDQLHALCPKGTEKARREYLSFAFCRKPGGKKLRRAIRRQLQYIRRNQKHIHGLLDTLEAVRNSKAFPLSASQQRSWFIVQTVQAQQEDTQAEKTRRHDDRIASLHQPHMRPIVRGKAGKAVEFGAKRNVALVGKLAFIDEFHWDTDNKSVSLPEQVERYRQRFGFYPQVVLADRIYGTRANRASLKEKGIRFGGKPLGRPKKRSAEKAAQMRLQLRQNGVEHIAMAPWSRDLHRRIPSLFAQQITAGVQY